MAAWTADDDDTLRRLHGEGRSLHSIAGEMGRSKGTISDKAEKLGLSWDKSATEAAVKSRRAVCADLRTRALERAYTRVHHLYDLLEAPGFKTILKGEYGTEHVNELDFVPPNDEKTLAQAIGAHMATAKRIEDADGDSAATAARSMLGALADQLGITDDLEQPDE